MGEATEATNEVKGVKRALDVLSAFTYEDSELSLSEICSRTELPKATVHRLLSTLVQSEFVFQDIETSKYRLGYKLMVMGSIARSQINYLKSAEPIFRKLVLDIDETVAVASLDGDRHMCTMVVEPERSVRVSSGAG